MPRREAPRRQCGAALLVALLLLAGLLWLTTSGAQSAALELAMSGNESWRLQALAAAERALALAEAALVAGPEGGTPAPVAGASEAELPGESYDYQVRDLGADARVVERSAGRQRARLYTLVATGHAARRSQVTIESGIRLVRDAGGALLAVERDYWVRRDID